MINSISASDLKNKTSEVLNSVYYRRETIAIKKHGRTIAKIIPVVTDKRRALTEINEAITKTFGLLPNFPDVTKFRRSRKRMVTLDVPD